MRNYTIFLLIAIIIQFTPQAASGFGNDFTCPIGKQGACLGYGDKVCSSMAKCVSNDAVCFDSYTCNYKGFTCKSKFDDLATEYDSLVDRYNRLLRAQRDLESCVSYASSLEEAQTCY